MKAASDVYSPVAGEVTAGNPKLATQPDLINRDPYGEGWIMRMKPAGGGVATETLDAAAYEAVVAGGRFEMPYIPHTPDDVRAMLDRIGVGSIDDLFDEIPPALRIDALPGVPDSAA